MKNGGMGGWKSMSKEDREFVASVFKEYDTTGWGAVQV
jgi:hypothetical protein